jgi:AraC-like DNA-binding protein
MQLYVSLFGFFVTFLLLVNIKATNRVNFFLFLFLLSTNIYNLAIYATLNAQNLKFMAVILVNFSPLYVLSGPLLYFYVRGIVNDNSRLQKSDILHFIPFIIYTINIGNYLFTSFSFKQKFVAAVIEAPSKVLDFDPVLIPGFLSHILRPVISLIYVVLCFVLLYKFYKRNVSHSQSKIVYRWLFALITVVFITYTVFLTSISQTLSKPDVRQAVIDGTIGVVVCMFSLMIINVLPFFFPRILYGLPQLDYNLKNMSRVELVPNEVSSKQDQDYGISDERIELLRTKISKYCENHPYINPNFSLPSMSFETGIPVHHISYYFNVILNTNFSLWKNGLRIKYVMDLMKTESAEILTLDAISKKAGFVSRNTFIASFKQHTGLTPSEYLNSL